MNENRPPTDTQLLRYGPPRAQASERLAPFPYTLDAGGPEQSAAVGAYWNILLRRRWTILTIVAIITTVVAITSFRMEPVYRATARVEIDSETPQIQSLQELFQQMPTDEDFLRTQIQVLQTDQLAWRTIEQLGLRTDPAFVKPKPADDKTDPDTRKLELIQGFKSRLAADLVPSSRVIRVSFESTNPKMAAKVVNGLVENYIDYNFREKYDATRQASARMEQQLDELKSKVEKSQQALVEYQRQHAIANVNDKQNVVEQRLSELSSGLSKAQNDRIEKEAMYHLLVNDPAQVASVVQNELLQKMQEKRADLQNQYTEALNQFGPNYPKVLRLQNQIEEADSQIQKERSRVLAKIRNEYTAAVDREKLLTREVSRQKEEFGNMNRLLVEQNILSGEFESNQKMYQTLLQRLKDATVSAGLRSTNVHLVDPALPPMVPIRPKRAQNILIALIAGIMMGVLIVVIQENLDHSVKTADEAEALLGSPTLALVPAARAAARGKLPMGPGSASSPHISPALEMVRRPRSPLAEAFRALRTSVLLSFSDRGHQAILVTSPNAGEGKTCTSINLAMALGQQGESVLVVDCDLRRPGVARTLGLDNRKGVSTLLAGRHALADVIQPCPDLPNVSFIPSGPIAHSPAELLSSEKMEELLRDLRDRYTFVIVDSPPMLAVTDASILATLVDGVVLVVSSGNTPRGTITQARRLLEATGAKVLGVVMNKIDVRHGEYYGYYGRYYTYGDGASTETPDETKDQHNVSNS